LSGVCTALLRVLKAIVEALDLSADALLSLGFDPSPTSSEMRTLLKSGQSRREGLKVTFRVLGVSSWRHALPAYSGSLVIELLR
jgi:hypothetical protein